MGLGAIEFVNVQSLPQIYQSKTSFVWLQNLLDLQQEWETYMWELSTQLPVFHALNFSFSYQENYEDVSHRLHNQQQYI